MTRVPHGYVSQEAADAVRVNTSPNVLDLITEYEQGLNIQRRTSCLVCKSPYRELIDELLRRGAGAESLSTFLFKRLTFVIGATALRRHKRNHLHV